MIRAKPEIRAVGGSIALSLVGHAAGLAALIWLATQLPPLRLPIKPSERAIEVVFELPRAAAPVPQLVPPQPLAPPSEPPVPTAPPPEMAAEPKPPPKPVARAPKKPAAERRPVEHSAPARVPHLPDPAPASPAPQMAVVPVPHPAPVPTPAPVVSGAYRGMLSAWFERHKRYPETARARGEEGRVGLTFRVARSGQLVDFSITGSSGYPELDAAVAAMMRGATLPPFPSDMIADDVSVTVSIRFGLSR